VFGISALSRSSGGVHAPHNVSFSGGEGEIVGLVGPNGSGKTTLVNTVAGTHRPDAGRIALGRPSADLLRNPSARGTYPGTQGPRCC
jgi:branched-chain amino acid transport system permease protein